MLAPLVLVVEDDAALRSVLARGLREEGFRCEAVGTGAQMLERVGDSAVPTPWCSTSACPTATAATPARHCAPAG